MTRTSVRMNGEELRKLAERVNQLNEQSKRDEFYKSCVKELAARLLAKVVKRTPVGQYPPGSGKVGGTLRRGWTASNDITVNKVGNNYVVEIINPVEYASYVEYGHRTANHKGWVNGRFMLILSALEIEKSAPQILNKKIENWLKECFK